jgi:hypothetical protein
MAIAAVVHAFVYPATPYVQEFNIMGIVAKTMAEEDREGTVARVKENFHDVVFGGGEDVSSLHPTLTSSTYRFFMSWSNLQSAKSIELYITLVSSPLTLF